MTETKNWQVQQRASFFLSFLHARGSFILDPRSKQEKKGRAMMPNIDTFAAVIFYLPSKVK